MKFLARFRQSSARRSGLSLTLEQAGQMIHHLEESLQAVEQAQADHRREVAEALRLGRRLQAQGDAGLWQPFDDLRGEVEALRAATSSEGMG